MDINKNRNATAPVFEFTLPVADVDADLQPGQSGKLVLPVEVVEKSASSYTFRKLPGAETEGNFRDDDLAVMRERAGVVENTEGSDKED